MPLILPAIAFVLVSSPAFAQAPATPPPPKLFASAGDVTALIANAKKERKPDQAHSSKPILRLAPYNANLEYRVAGLNAPASVHEKEAVIFLVVEGSGTLFTRGELKR